MAKKELLNIKLVRVEGPVSSPSPAVESPDSVESLDRQIEKEQRLLDHDRDQHLTVTVEGDADKLAELKARRDALRENSSTATPQPEIEPTPEPAPQVNLEPTPPESTPTNRLEAKSFNEVMALQKDAFLARREMIAFRHGKKITELSVEDQAKYAEFRQNSQDRRKQWLSDLKSLSAEEQTELMGMTKLKEVEARFSQLSPDQIVDTVSQEVLVSKKDRLATLSVEILKEEELLKYDKDTARVVTAQGNKEDLKELKVRHKTLIAKIAELEAGKAPVAEEVNVTNAEKVKSENAEQALAEARAKERELLQAGINELDRQAEAKKKVIEETPTWKVLPLMQLRMELRQINQHRDRLENELRGEKLGFGAKFKESVAKAYNKAKNKLKNEQGGVLVVESSSESAQVATESVDSSASAEGETHPTSEAEKSRKTWKGWAWERTKGLATFGYWEVHQAERFRSSTKKTAETANLLVSQIQKERNLSLEDALAEAEQIKATLGGEEGLVDAESKDINKISTEITARKVIENNAKVGEIIVHTIADLEDKLRKYKGVSGQEVLTDEAKNKIAIDLQGRLNGMRGSYIGTDAKEFSKMMRENLEPDWWKRYVYAGLELALDSTVVYLGAQLFTPKFVAAKAGTAGAKGATEVALKDTIWAEAKRQLVSNGVTNPTDAQIQQIATKFCQDSGVKVMKGGQLLWSKTAGGAAIDTILSKGFVVKIAGGLKQIALMHP